MNSVVARKGLVVDARTKEFKRFEKVQNQRSLPRSRLSLTPAKIKDFGQYGSPRSCPFLVAVWALGLKGCRKVKLERKRLLEPSGVKRLRRERYKKEYA